MKELIEALTALTPDVIFRFVAVIVPGFVAIRTYYGIRGGDSPKSSESLIDYAIFSGANDVVWYEALRIERVVPLSDSWRSTIEAIGGILAVTVSPILLAYGWSRLQTFLAAKRLIADPRPKPWDYIFEEIFTETIGILITLTDGRRVGGKFARPSFTSTFPADEQIYVSSVWKLSDSGSFIAPLAGTRGVLVDKKDIITVEFFDWNTVLDGIEQEEHGKGEDVSEDGARPGIEKGTSSGRASTLEGGETRSTGYDKPT